MASVNASAAATPERTPIVKVVTASLIGTTVEWYDFFLYGLAAGVVFNRLFFPSFDPLVGTLLAFATFGVGFAARPIGGVVFGHFGDRLGRKKLLVLSLTMMGGATFLMGLLPTYATIGIWAPILLILLRLIQGFALGGEWGGAVLIVSEHGDAQRRGFWASWPQAGAPGGNLLAAGVLGALAAFQSEEAFNSWGWRVPFLLSAVLVVIGLYIRVSISESPVFQQAQARAEQRAAETGVREKPPLMQVLRHYRRQVLIAMAARFAENMSFYIFTIFLGVYLKNQLNMSTSFALNAVLIASAIEFVAIPAWGALSDRVGRRPVYLFGAIGIAVWGYVFFALLDTRSFVLTTLAVTVGLLFHGAMYGPQAAFLSELFGTKVRYSGASVGYQLASILAGGLAPFIATALLREYRSGTPVAIYLTLAGLVSILGILVATETRSRDLDADDAVDVTVEAAGRR
jgi:metabolite-proton symporter